jgi:dihydroflavonol-4-reductase
MKVLVTGSNGFLGSHVVKFLLEAGYTVRAFILKGTSQANLEGLTYETFEGDLLNPSNLEAALETCDYVIHTAAVTDVWPTKNPLSWRINYELVKQLSAAVRKKSIKKLIHVGTANSFGFGSKTQPGNENTAFNSGKYGLDYINSKKAAQNFLLAEAKAASPLPVVIINPTFMIGENDSKPGPGEMIISVIKGKVPGYAAGGRCFAAVKDVARACVAALDKGQIGQCYITGGTNLNYREFFTLVSKMTNVKPPKRKIPTSIAVIFAAMIQFIAKLRKRKPLLTVSMAKISGDGHYYSSLKAINELGYTQTSIEICLKEAIDWYQSHGYIN